MPAPVDARLQRLLDRAEIEDVLKRYYRGLDRFDLELMLEAFHPGARERHGGWGEGDAAEVSRRLLETASTFSSSHIHFLSNVMVDFEGEDRASCEAYLHAVSRIEGTGGRRDFVFMGRLVDRFERRDGCWKIIDRLLVKDVDKIDPVVEITRDPDGSKTVRGRRDRQDPSYRKY